VKDATKAAADAGGLVGPDVVAACALSAVPGLGASAIARLTELFGTLADALDAGPAQIIATAEVSGLRLRQEAIDFLGRKPDLEALGAWAVSAAKAAGARVVVLGDPWYPPLLRGIEYPPPLLYVRGGLVPDAPRIAVVGARESDDYGVSLAREIAEGLARAGVQVVSGGARGVDAAAHAGALWAGGSTCAVLGCGIDIVYPPENGPLFDRLASGGGAVISEFPPNTPASRSNFPRRNRTIAGLCAATVIVRARLESGAILTANNAAQQGRMLFAVPGQHGEELSEAPNSLLTAGVAQAATSAEDILRVLGWPLPPPPAEPRKRKYIPPPPPPRQAAPARQPRPPPPPVLSPPPPFTAMAPSPQQGTMVLPPPPPGTVLIASPQRGAGPMPPPVPAGTVVMPPPPPVGTVLMPSPQQGTAVMPPPPPPGTIEASLADISSHVIDEESARLLAALDDREALHVDELAKRAGVSVATALSRLLELEIQGLCVQKPGKCFLRR